jgi:hypothetical protein
MTTQDNFNPYATSSISEPKPDRVVADAASTRESRKGEEANLKQDALCLVGNLVLLAAVQGVFVFQPQPSAQRALMIGLAVVTGCAALSGIVVYRGVRKLASWSRKPLAILASISLLAFPLGTAFGVSVLLNIYSNRKPRLLSNEYEAIVRCTREMDDRTSKMTRLIVVLPILLLFAVIFAILVRPEHHHQR